MVAGLRQVAAQPGYGAYANTRWVPRVQVNIFWVCCHTAPEVEMQFHPSRHLMKHPLPPHALVGDLE
jgi:hypothetical protein